MTDAKKEAGNGKAMNAKNFKPSGYRTRPIAYERGFSGKQSAVRFPVNPTKPVVLLVMDSNGRNIVNPQKVNPSLNTSFDFAAISIPGGKTFHACTELQHLDISHHKVAHVVLALGTNDMSEGCQVLHRLRPRVKKLIDVARAVYPGATISYASVLQRHDQFANVVSEANRIIRQMATDLRMQYLEVDVPSMPWYWSDFIHLSDDGLRCYMRAMEREIESKLFENKDFKQFSSWKGFSSHRPAMKRHLSCVSRFAKSRLIDHNVAEPHRRCGSFSESSTSRCVFSSENDLAKEKRFLGNSSRTNYKLHNFATKYCREHMTNFEDYEKVENLTGSSLNGQCNVGECAVPKVEGQKVDNFSKNGSIISTPFVNARGDQSSKDDEDHMRLKSRLCTPDDNCQVASSASTKMSGTGNENQNSSYVHIDDSLEDVRGSDAGHSSRVVSWLNDTASDVDLCVSGNSTTENKFSERTEGNSTPSLTTEERRYEGLRWPPRRLFTSDDAIPDGHTPRSTSTSKPPRDSHWRRSRKLYRPPLARSNVKPRYKVETLACDNLQQECKIGQSPKTPGLACVSKRQFNPTLPVATPVRRVSRILNSSEHTNKNCVDLRNVICDGVRNLNSDDKFNSSDQRNFCFTGPKSAMYSGIFTLGSPEVKSRFIVTGSQYRGYFVGPVSTVE